MAKIFDINNMLGMEFNNSFTGPSMSSWADANGLTDPSIPVGYEYVTVTQVDPGEYQYFAAFVTMLGQRVAAPGHSVRVDRIWANDVVIYDRSTGYQKSGAAWEFFDGNEAQGAVYRGIHYRDRMVLYFPDMNLKEFGNSIPAITAELVDFMDGSDENHTVAEVMTAYAQKVGYDPGSIEAVNLDGMAMNGYVVNGDGDLANLATSIGNLFGFNWSQRVGTITFKSYYNDGALQIDATIPFERIALLAESDDANYFTQRRNDPETFPTQMSLSFFDFNNEYRQGFETATRGDITKHEQASDFSMPIVLNGGQARSLITDVMFRAWARRLEFNIRTTAEYVLTDAGDAIQFIIGDTAYEGLITSHRTNADNSVILTLTEIPTATYPVIVPTQPAIVVPPIGGYELLAFVLDIPALTVAEVNPDTPRFIVMVHGAGDLFGGAELQLAPQSAPTGWVTETFLTADDQAAVGTLDAILEPPADPFAVDTVNSLYLAPGTIPPALLVNASDAELNAGANLIAVGTGSEVELIQFGGVELIDGVYRLFNLRRGRYGTELYARTDWEPDTLVSFPSTGVAVDYPLTVYTNGETLFYRVIAKGQEASNAERQTFLPEAYSARRYAPVDTRFTRMPNDDLRISWNVHNFGVNAPPLASIIEGAGWTGGDAHNGTEIRFNVDGLAKIVTVAPGLNERTLTPAEQIALGLEGDETELEAVIGDLGVKTGLGVSEWIEYTVGTFEVQELGLTMGLGGSMSIYMIGQTVSLALDMALGGEMTIREGEPEVVEFALVMELGGSMAAEMDEPPPQVIVGPKYSWGRIVFMGSYSGNYITEREVRFFDEQGDLIAPGSNRGGTQGFGSNPPGNLFDGNDQNNVEFSNTSNGLAGAYTDFADGEAYIQSMQMVHGPYTNEHPTGIKVYGSNDGTNWVLLWTQTDDMPAAPGGGAATTWQRPPYQPSLSNLRYWQLYVTESNGGSGLDLFTVNFNLGGIVRSVTPANGSASSYYVPENLNPGNAFDQNAFTRWATDFSNTWPQWLTYDFGEGENQTIDTVQIRVASAANRSPRDFQMRYSADGVNWFVAGVWTDEPDWGIDVLKSFDFTAPNPGTVPNPKPGSGAGVADMVLQIDPKGYASVPNTAGNTAVTIAYDMAEDNDMVAVGTPPVRVGLSWLIKAFNGAIMRAPWVGVDAFSITMVVKADYLAGADALLLGNNYDADVTKQFGLFQVGPSANGNTPSAFTFKAGGIALTSHATAFPNNARIVTATRDGDGNAKLYVGGVEVSSGLVGSALIDPATIQIGGTGANIWWGEVEAHDRVLTPTEVAALYDYLYTKWFT